MRPDQAPHEQLLLLPGFVRKKKPIPKKARRARLALQRQLKKREAQGSSAGVVVSFRLSPSEVRQLLEKARAEEESISELIRTALYEYAKIGELEES